tara:strand:+ start:162 stop:335 length:174 start_codon:yes stop_codon:yes gene_type:complete
MITIKNNVMLINKNLSKPFDKMHEKIEITETTTNELINTFKLKFADSDDKYLNEYKL